MRAFRLGGGLHALPRHAEAKEEEHGAEHSDDGRGRLPAPGFGCDPRRTVGPDERRGEERAEGFEEGQSQKRSAVGEEHAVGGEDRTLLGVGGHYAEHGAIGDVDGRVNDHHQHVGRIGPYQFARIT